MRYIDEKGKKYGKWTVVEIANRLPKEKSMKWLCRCECGTESKIEGYRLRNGSAKRCSICANVAFIDISGERFGKWHVIERACNNKKGNVMWLCRCDCGHEQILRAISLRSGQTTQCLSCYGKSRQVDISGGKFGKWSVIKKSGRGSNRNTLWECKCECGYIQNLPSSRLIGGYSEQCQKCQYSSYRISKVNSSLFSKIKNNAKNRKIEFSISKQDVEKQFDKQGGKCALSGLPIILIESKTEYKKNCSKVDNMASLDRIDSNRGYTADNVQWVHKKINFMKNNLSEREFLFFCKKIAEHNNGKKFYDVHNA